VRYSQVSTEISLRMDEWSEGAECGGREKAHIFSGSGDKDG
jgi:hypothetical protein